MQFSEQERTAMKRRAAELRNEASRSRSGKAAANELDVLEKIDQMPSRTARWQPASMRW